MAKFYRDDHSEMQKPGLRSKREASQSPGSIQISWASDFPWGFCSACLYPASGIGSEAVRVDYIQSCLLGLHTSHTALAEHEQKQSLKQAQEWDKR